MNIPLLKRVKRAILKRPGQFEMGSFFADILSFNNGTKEIPASRCGTAACIAGWAVHLSEEAKTLKDTCRAQSNRSDDIEERALDVLQLTPGEGHSLFYHRWWPEKFCLPYDKATSATTRAKVAAARIDWFIKTKGAE